MLVSQDLAQIEHYGRKKNGEWSYRLYTGLKASFKIPSIGCTLKLADVYERITFPKVRVLEYRRPERGPFDE